MQQDQKTSSFLEEKESFIDLPKISLLISTPTQELLPKLVGWRTPRPIDLIHKLKIKIVN